jgi:Fic family protein
VDAHPRSGRLVTTSTIGEVVRAYLPTPLPPDPPLALTQADHELIDRANRSLGRLDGLSLMLPDTRLFVYLYVRKEAVLSSQIEGAQSSLSDLLLHESAHAPGVPLDDVVEVSNYVAALTQGLDRMRGGSPLSLRLIREMHERLMAGARGGTKQPGELRGSQTWIGGTRPGLAAFVPPPPEEVMPCMGALELFLHGRPLATPVLLRAALAHVQFETIHPFLDGNGRMGRLLIPLLLCAEGVLAEPVLYLSLYFKRHRQAYYAHLQAVRERGDWEGWVRFFMAGVEQTADQAVSLARSILTLFGADRAHVLTLGRPAGTALRVHDALKRHPILSIQQAAEQAAVSIPAATTAIQHLEQLGLAREITGRQRGKLYLYERYLSLLNEGMEAEPG